MKEGITNNLWIVTSEINEYNQDGEYFEVAFTNKPTLEQLSIFLYKCSLDKLNENQIISVVHLYNGGGRKGVEYLWYNLHQVEEGNKL